MRRSIEALHLWQSGVVDGDNKVKERLQSCAVSRRVLLNLHTQKLRDNLSCCFFIYSVMYNTNRRAGPSSERGNKHVRL